MSNFHFALLAVLLAFMAGSNLYRFKRLESRVKKLEDQFPPE